MFKPSTCPDNRNRYSVHLCSLIKPLLRQHDCPAAKGKRGAPVLLKQAEYPSARTSPT